MAIKITQWEYSDEIEQPDVPVEEGDRYLFVRNAYLTDDKVYIISFKDLQNEAEFTIKHKMNKADDNGNIIRNNKARGTLVTLGHAILGTEKGVPHPDDIIGGVCHAEIKLNEFKGKMYPNIYRYEPVNYEWSLLGTMEEQYYEEDEE